MRSTRAPLGSIDTRLKMTDTPPDGPLSSSFSSIIGFDDLMHRDYQPLDCPGNSEPKMNNRVRFVSGKSHKSTCGRGIGKPYPRLELDVALDKYHCLDGFTEPVSPRNTPASTSGGVSPEASPRPVDTQAMRASSAPQIQSLAFEWFDGKSEGDLAYMGDDAEGGIKPQRRRFSADDEPRSSSTIIPPKDIPQTTSSVSIEKIGETPAYVPGVRFSPPPAPPPKPHSPPANRPLPTLDRKVDGIATHRQHKHSRKWKGPSRAFSQRVSPYRSPAKAPKATPLNRQSDGPLSHLLPLSGHQGGSRDQATQTDPSQETVEHNVSESLKTVAAGATGGDVATSLSQISDLVGLSLSIYRVRHPEQQSAPAMSGSVFQVEMTSNPFPFNTSSQKREEVEHALNRQALEDLVFHTYLVLPASVARIPNAMFSIMKRACNSRIGTMLLYLEKMFWSIVIALFLGILNKFRRPGTGPGTGSRIPNGSRR